VTTRPPRRNRQSGRRGIDHGQIATVKGWDRRLRVRDPHLVRAIGNDILGKAREEWPGVVAVGRGDISPSPLGLKTVLAHQAAQLLAVHHDALVA
jgi:hypothetical protein